MTQKEKYIWLIDTIYRAKEITLEELSYKWRDYIGGNVDDKLHRATFNRWRDAIYLQFKLDIKCNRKNNKYYISNPEVIEEDKLKKWMLDTFATGNMLSENLDISDRILVNSIPSGLDYLKPIIEAMKKNRKVLIEYLQYEKDYSSTFPIEPYCVKLFEGRWYLLGRNNFGKVRVYCLDRINDLVTLDETFILPKDFDEAFDSHYGIIIGNDIEPQIVVIRAFGIQKEYLKSLPLHKSQKLKEDTEKYADFSLYIAPTFDFQQKLLSFGSAIEVIKPVELRNEIKSKVAEMAMIYNQNH